VSHPTRGYTKIHSTAYAFAALKADGSIVAWGDSSLGGTGAPSDSGYTKIYSTGGAFAAVKADGSITALPPKRELPHAVIDPSALRATKACSVE
jgi:hypothetical protein